MASQHDALWAKLHELERQLAAYKLLRAPRGADGGADTPSLWATEETCRGRQYDAYMRRRDARREAAAAEQQRPAKAQGARVAGRSNSKPMSPRCTARDGQQEVKRTPTVSIPSSTPRRESATALPRSRTVSAGATGSPARPHHQRRSSLGAPVDLGDGAATPRPFLKRGTGTGGAARPRVHDLPSVDAPVTPRPPQLERVHARTHAHAARHVRSVSELPFDTASLASPRTTTQARARKRWGSPERPAAMLSAPADSHSTRDFSKGLKKLLNFVRKGGRGDADPLGPAVPSTTGTGGSGKPVRKGWSRGAAACSLLDVPFDRASLDGHRFPMTRTVGISS